MDNTDDWHVVQRKKKDVKTNVPPYIPTNKNNIPQTNRPHLIQKKNVNTKNNFPKNNNSFLKLNTKNNLEHNNLENILDNNDNKNNLEQPENIINDLKPMEILSDGNDIILVTEYVLWVHSINENDWSINGYKQLCTIKTVSDFWKLFNNIHKLNFKNNNFYFMKPKIEPIWEDENNRHGGICSFRIELDHALKVYELLCIFLVCEKLVVNIDDINGISITPKNNWAIIKIWNKDKTNKTDKLLHKSILDKYKHVSIQYKQNQPEY
jgi:hypothetical protein